MPSWGAVSWSWCTHNTLLLLLPALAPLIKQGCSESATWHVRSVRAKRDQKRRALKWWLTYIACLLSHRLHLNSLPTWPTPERQAVQVSPPRSSISWVWVREGFRNYTSSGDTGIKLCNDVLKDRVSVSLSSPAEIWEVPEESVWKQMAETLSVM